MYILGLSAFYHDSAAAIIKDGEIIAAAQEERFTRIKHDFAFPNNAIKYCLEEAGIQLPQVDYVVFYDKPFLKFERLLETYIACVPFGLKSFLKSMPLWLKEKLFQKRLIVEALTELYPDESIDWKSKLLFNEHHLSHAASAFYPSPFDQAIVLTLDGVGEWATTSVAIGKGNDLKVVKEIHFPHSLGLLYSAFTYYCGFKVNSGEYKLMGLAPYGTPHYTDLILENLLDLKEDGSFKLHLSFFDYCVGLRMTNRKFHKLFGMPPRKPEEELTQKHMDIAASIQKVTEIILITMAKHLRKAYDIKYLCLAGGVALNCVANGKLLNEKIFDGIWIQPAAGDSGGAIGAALSAYHLYKNQPRIAGSKDKMHGSFLGPAFTQQDVEERLKAAGAQFRVLPKDELLAEVVSDLESEKVVGFFAGRMEFGPRALGARSIIADPRSTDMQKKLNLKIKFRESFRPFAPAILREHVNEYFDLDTDSPYMLLVSPVKTERRRKLTDAEQKLFGIELLNSIRSDIPAVTHVDYSARVQTVDAESNPHFHALLSAFYAKTNCPVLVNTSFNIRGEPIVCTPEDAFRCFMGTDMDVLVVENCLLKKEDQPANLYRDYRNNFTLD